MANSNNKMLFISEPEEVHMSYAALYGNDEWRRKRRIRLENRTAETENYFDRKAREQRLRELRFQLKSAKLDNDTERADSHLERHLDRHSPQYLRPYVIAKYITMADRDGEKGNNLTLKL